MSSHHQNQTDDNRLIYTPSMPIDIAALCLVAGIERPCKGLRINFEDWGRLNFPAWCGLVAIHPCDDVPMNSIEAVRA